MKKIMILCLCFSLLLTGGCVGNTHIDETAAEKGTVSSANETALVTDITEELSAETVSESSAEDEEKEAEENETDVIFSAESGIYGEAFELELSCDNDDEIYYTTDGSDPSESDTRIKYTEPLKITDRKKDRNVIAAVDPMLFTGSFSEFDRKAKEFRLKVSAPSDEAVDKCTVIRAAALNSDGIYSECESRTYYIGTAEEHIKGLSESCKASGNTLAVISISMDKNDLFDEENGIYVKGSIWKEAFEKALGNKEKIDGESARSFDANYKQKGREWERECHIDFFEFDENGAELALAQDCGIRIQGNYSRSDLQKGFRLFARKDYGEKRFDYPVFGDKTDVDSFKTLTLRAGGNCAFTAKFNDTYWQTIAKQAGLDCSVQTSRPCVVYMNGEYFGLYVLQEDYSEDYFADHYGVDDKEVVIYKGDAEKYKTGYYLDEGALPEGIDDEGYFFEDLMNFFRNHPNLSSSEDYDEFSKLVDIDSVRDYFLAEVWINNKWDWPGKNWSMWKTASDDGSKYGDGRWRFMFYDMEFGGVSGRGDANANTVKDDNYKPLGLLDMDTKNPAVLCFAYLMTNESFRSDYCDRLISMGEDSFSIDNLSAVLKQYTDEYSPLYEQFFARYPGSGSADEAVNGGYASAACISDFIGRRGKMIPRIVKWINENSR